MDTESLTRMIIQALSEQGVSVDRAGGKGLVPVGVSNRHIHLTQADVETLFGAGYQLTPLKDLSQPGQYACKETLTLVGPSMRAIERVRVLRPGTQGHPGGDFPDR